MPFLNNQRSALEEECGVRVNKRALMRVFVFAESFNGLGLSYLLYLYSS